MTDHRFEIGECVIHLEKRFPNGTRRSGLVVLAKLAGVHEPEYRLRAGDGLARYVLAESELSPPPFTDAGRRLNASATEAVTPGGTLQT